MRKHDSKRRWIARFFQNKLVPFTAIEEHPDLRKRLRPMEYMDDMDCIRRRKTIYETHENLHAAKSVRELVIAARELGNAEFDAGIRRDVIAELSKAV